MDNVLKMHGTPSSVAEVYTTSGVSPTEDRVLEFDIVPGGGAGTSISRVILNGASVVFKTSDGFHLLLTQLMALAMGLSNGASGTT